MEVPTAYMISPKEREKDSYDSILQDLTWTMCEKALNLQLETLLEAPSHQSSHQDTETHPLLWSFQESWQLFYRKPELFA
ncbi:TPK1 isoform 2 [Pan troglodytes]|uniref:TPK1 isoform 2 n=1 Tax=Pan troglodytes TaxID=9598 RepID=A0A2J8QUM0_PANTR|nr:TPK1 isoform 2 [Pan troglodytes]